MGSLPSPPRPVIDLPPSPESSASNFKVYAVFSPTEQCPNTYRSNSIEFYNRFSNRWTRASSIPGLVDNHFLKGFAMVSLGDSIYIIGGRLCHRERSHGPDQDDSDHDFVEVDVDVLPLVLCYNVRSEQWSRCAPLGTPRYDFACSVHDNKIYVAGGKSTLATARGLPSAEVYNPRLDMWTPLPNMNTLRYMCVGVTWQSKFYVVGGFAEEEDSDSRLNMVLRSSAEVYDTQARKWDLIQGMWQLDVPPNQIVTVDAKLFSCGDCLNAWKGHIEVYDGEVNIWNEVDGSQGALNSLSSASNNDENWRPNQRLYLTMAPIGTRIYFFTGHRMAGELSRTMSRVHVFDTSATSNAWRSLDPMEEVGLKELFSHCCVVEVQ
ncbi:kelch-like protein 8 [Juglans microcarpa x Juglans regia]|uniref:kelch-like protein 8 n=1 Tax=Juglans microcarpa x Juglans regia TaxID=2249226 RepID=UPI001B7EDE73|nr:kelch-like protein 8 [Juglans microcarpa x Juglans regia]